VLCVLAGGLVACVPAWAARGHVFTGAFGSAGSGAGELTEPAGVAVDEASGDVYVVDRGDNRVEWFSAGGVFEGQFNGSGSFEVEGTPETGAPAEAGEFAGPEAIAIDNFCSLHKPKPLVEPECHAADPSAGDVYVLDAGHEVIDKFTAEGAYVGQVTVGGETIEGLGVDAHGKLWVATHGGSVHTFNDEEANVEVSSVAATLAGAFNEPGFAVDSEEDLYLHSEASVVFKVGPHGCTDGGGCGGNGFSSLPGLLNGSFDPVASEWFSVEFASDDVYVDHGGVVSRRAAGGELLESLGSEVGLGELSAGAGVGVSSASETVYVAEAGSDQVFVYGPEAAGAPRVVSEAISDVTQESARLEASVIPGNLTSEEAAVYRFEYGPCVSAGACSSSGYAKSVPVPDGVLGAGFEAVVVAPANVQGLAADTSYHFRVVAMNMVGGARRTVDGEERVFTTQATGALVLPDGREWELVSPADKHGANLTTPGEMVAIQAAAGGGAMTYSTDTPTESEPAGYTTGAQVFSVRGADGWSSRDLAVAHEASVRGPVGTGNEYRIFSADLSHAIVQPLGPLVKCRSAEGASLPCLSAQASEQTAFVESDFLDENPVDGCVQPSGAALEGGAPGCFQPLVTGAAGVADVPAGTVFGEEGTCAPPQPAHAFCGPKFLTASANLEHVVLESPTPLSSPAGGNLYEWTAGQPLAPITILPKGEGEAPVAGNPGTFGEDVRNAISADGSRVFWSGVEHEILGTGRLVGPLYVRDVARGETLRVSAGEAEFQDASEDGSRVFYIENGALTECHIVVGVGGLECEGGGSVLGAGELGAIPGVSGDGSWVYFVSSSVLAAGGVAGSPNLYVRHAGVTGLVAVLSGADFPDWAGHGAGSLPGLTARVSGDGRWLAFMSQRGLTGYDTRDAVTGQPDEEVYLYHAPESLASGHGELVCASCDPSGARPVGEEAQKISLGNHGGIVGGQAWVGSGASLAALVPGYDPYRLKTAVYQPRYLSDSGRVFFDARDSLVSGAAGGSWDVYEYEPAGVGPEDAVCGSGVANGGEVFKPGGEVKIEGRGVVEGAGCVGLVSGGGSGQESVFLDASEAGGDVFFMTTARLVPGDVDDAYDVYDAHECTSLVPCFPAGVLAPPACDNEASCRPAPSPQPEVYGAPGSATFQGAGNLTPSPPSPAVKKVLTRAQKLAAALRSCRKDHGAAKRVACERKARREFGAKASKAKAKARGSKANAGGSKAGGGR
jgi:DNA-binding beta-propeller fold protein YncE